MNFKRIALTVLFVVTMAFVINTDTANAEDATGIEGVAVQPEAAVMDVMAETPEVPAEVTGQVDNVVDTGSSYTEALVPQVLAENEIKVKAGSASPSKDYDYTKAELRLMSAIIYCESNNEPYAGKLGVGIVVMNRVESKAFPNTVKGVIYQRSQFSPARNGSLKKALAKYDAGKFKSKNEKQCIKAAKAALSGVKSVEYKGQKKSFKSYKYFSGYVRGSKYKIKGHMFK